MRSFTLSRRTLLFDVAVALAVGVLFFAAYFSILTESGTVGGLGISARGTITSIDPSMRVIAIDHEPVKALNAQAMQMSFGVTPQIDLATLRVGSKVVFTLGRREGDLYIIDAIKPAM